MRNGHQQNPVDGFYDDRLKAQAVIAHLAFFQALFHGLQGRRSHQRPPFELWKQIINPFKKAPHGEEEK